MNKPSSKVAGAKKATEIPQETKTELKSEILGVSTNNPPISPDDFVIDVVDNTQRTIEEVQEAEIESFNNLNPDDEHEGDVEQELGNEEPTESIPNIYLGTTSLTTTFNIISESRAVYQKGRNNTNFQIGTDFSTRILKTGFATYNEALDYLNSNVNSEEFKNEGDFAITKIYNRK